MSRSMVFTYQLLTGISDSSTGVLLVVAPALTLHMLDLSARSGALVYLSFVGAFVFSVGLACLYGALLAHRGDNKARLEMVWLLTAFTRASVALFRASQAWAYLEGRTFVLPDDVARVAESVLAHRLLLDVDRELRGATDKRVVADVLAHVAIPALPEPSAGEA